MVATARTIARHTFHVTNSVDAPTIVLSDGTVRSFRVLTVEHTTSTTALLGLYADTTGRERLEVLETWEEPLTDAQALSEAEFLSTPLTIAA